MASLVTEKNGRRRVDFIGADKVRRKIRLGMIEKRAATTIKIRIEQIVSSQITGGGMPDDVSRWLMEIEDDMHERLASVGLVQPRHTGTLGLWLDNHLSGLILKPGSIKSLRQTRDKLVAFFTPIKQLRKITQNEASDWRLFLQKQGLVEATVKSHCGNAKTLFNEALRRRILPENPFLHLASGITATSNNFYLVTQLASQIVEACPTTNSKLLFALGRFAGLRVPSESSLLTWDDVDWVRGRLNVKSPKTERFKGHAERVVPICPALMKVLEKAFEDAPEGAIAVCPNKASGNIRLTLQRVLKRLGIPAWDDFFQTLRRSCEIEWAEHFPQFAVSRWIGHSISVSGRHYANHISDDVYSRVSGIKSDAADAEKVRGSEHAAQNAAHSIPELGGNLVKTEEVIVGKNCKIPPVSMSFQNNDQKSMRRRRDSNLSPTGVNAINSIKNQDGGAESGAVGVGGNLPTSSLPTKCGIPHPNLTPHDQKRGFLSDGGGSSPTLLTLPWPPSVNHYWRHVGSKVLISQEGRRYREKIGFLVAKMRAAGKVSPSIAGDLSVEIVAYPPDRRDRDLDNLLKSLCDALQHAGIYANDSQIGRLLIERGEVKAGGEMVVVIAARGT